VLKSTVGQHIR